MSLFTRGTELQRFRRGMLPKISLAVLLVIPLIYGALYLWAFWAPTDNMNHLPVAVVNLDEPAEKPDGELLTAGDDVLDELQAGKDLDWKPLGAEDAATAVADGDVYFSVTIPSDFSRTLAGLQDDPRAGTLEVQYNDNNSFLASTLGKQAMVQLRDAVAETTTRTAAEQVLVGVEKLSDGTRDAADAAATLESGTKQVSEGTQKLSAGLGELADGTAQIVEKSPELVSGTQQLAGGLGTARTGSAALADGNAALAAGAGEAAEKSGQLSAGLGQLSAGAGELSASLEQLSDGTVALSSGAGDLAAGADALAAGAGQLAAGTATASQGAASLAENAGALASGSAQVSGGLGAIAGFAAAHPDATIADLEAALAQNGTSLAAVSAAAQQVSAGAGQLAEGAGQLSAGIAGADTGAQTLAGKSGELAGGAHTLADKTVTLRDSTALISSGAGTLAEKSAVARDGGGQLAAGLGTLADGTQTAATGSSELAAGVAQAADGANRLADGAGQLAAGATQLNDGAQEASSKSGELATGAKRVTEGSGTFADALAEGAAEAPEFSDGQTVKIAETMAKPVALDESTENAVQGFGEGFAPFFIALASFVGALITWLILRPLPRRPLASNVSGLRSVLAGFWPAALIGLGQVVIMMLVLVYGIGMQPAHWVGMAAFMLLVTLAFLALQQMFIAVLGTAAGRVVSLVLLMLQLSSSGGTYPVETTPKFFQILHPFMPASYVVDGLRQLIGGGIDGRFWAALAVMAAVFVVSLAISAIAARRQKVWTISRLHPSLAI
ncbi:YhgE/Pip domain-containing protein [Leucobacter sp. PH1c]|uniref:YhgE/Pip domain-containing protein n=1 Tax=Leucobacter sp. PH1c TaxID=1397278 RepID=UPI000468AEED|nr:YhgE/Pip domain-containing protein [Leucobacter sp. PH1c]